MPLTDEASDDALPALYWAADDASNCAQADLFLAHKVNSVLLVSAALVAMVSALSPWLAAASAALFLGSLAAQLYSEYRALQSRWYQARALAESVKTAAWRLMMSADPFGRANETENLDAFRALLSELLQENHGIGDALSGDWSRRDQVTERMLAMMRAHFSDKLARYQADRIDSQRDWYARRASQNRADSRRYLGMIVVTYAIAIAMLLIRVARPDFVYLPIEAAAVVASSVISWKQLRRVDELASAYGLTAHELGIIKSKSLAIDGAARLAAFVSDAENAFSREHTQWAARRDH
jgi:hypothetical protein